MIVWAIRLLKVRVAETSFQFKNKRPDRTYEWSPSTDFHADPMTRTLFTILMVLSSLSALSAMSACRDAPATQDSPSLSERSGPSVLVITAHPDDEAMFAATMYRVTHALGGDLHLALITDGAGGYRFSTLAEPLYGTSLTDEAVARTELPAIRKKELEAGGRIVGISQYFYLDQPDEGKTENADSVMKYVWDTDQIASRLDQILSEHSYDFIFTHLPIKPFHAHHKAATILALEAVNRMPPERRPIILGSFSTGGMDDVVAQFQQLEGFPVTAIRKDVGPWTFDRATPFGTDNRLHYGIIANWLISEHKSQGTMQLFMAGPNPGTERFWLYALNPSTAAEKATALFDAINAPPHPF